MKSSNSKVFKNGPKLSIEFHIKDSQIVSTNLNFWEGLGLQRLLLGNNIPLNLQTKIDNWLEIYVSGKNPKIDLPLASHPFSPFTQQVHKELSKIGYGKTISYKDLSSRCQRPNAYRAAGSACGRNPFLLIIPCHRVINSQGGLGGFGGGLEIKEALLSFESRE